MAADTLCSGFLSFEIMMHSEYDGFWFYAPHLIEMCLEIFGNQITSVSAVKQGESLVATLQYPQVVVMLHFTPSKAEHRCLLITREGSQVYDLDISDCYSKEAEKFAQMLNGQWKGLTVGEMTLPVYLIDAILRAADTGECIALNSE